MADAEDRARIELANRRLEALSNDGQRGPGRRSNSAPRPGVTYVHRGPSRVDGKDGQRGESAGNDAYTPGQNRESLGKGGAELGSVEPTRGRAKRVGGSGTQTGRQTSGSSLQLVHPVQAKSEEFVLKYIKKALAYAGFDVRSDARSLSAEEIERYRPDVCRFIQRVGISLDWALTHSNRNHEECEIWVFEDDEATTLANIWLKRAKTIGWMAEVSRQVHHVEDLGDAKDIAAILGKRIAATPIFIGNNGGVEFWLQNRK